MTLTIFRSPAEAAQFLHEAGMPKKDAADFVAEIALLTAAERDRALDACSVRIAGLLAGNAAADRVAGSFASLYAAIGTRDITIGVLRMALRRAAALLESVSPDDAAALRKTAGAP